MKAGIIKFIEANVLAGNLSSSEQRDEAARSRVYTRWVGKGGGGKDTRNRAHVGDA